MMTDTQSELVTKVVRLERENANLIADNQAKDLLIAQHQQLLDRLHHALVQHEGRGVAFAEIPAKVESLLAKTQKRITKEVKRTFGHRRRRERRCGSNH